MPSRSKKYRALIHSAVEATHRGRHIPDARDGPGAAESAFRPNLAWAQHESSQRTARRPKMRRKTCAGRMLSAPAVCNVHPNLRLISTHASHAAYRAARAASGSAILAHARLSASSSAHAGAMRSSPSMLRAMRERSARERASERADRFLTELMPSISALLSGIRSIPSLYAPGGALHFGSIHAPTQTRRSRFAKSAAFGW